MHPHPSRCALNKVDENKMLDKRKRKNNDECYGVNLIETQTEIFSEMGDDINEEIIAITENNASYRNSHYIVAVRDFGTIIIPSFSPTLTKYSPTYSYHRCYVFSLLEAIFTQTSVGAWDL